MTPTQPTYERVICASLSIAGVIGLIVWGAFVHTVGAETVLLFTAGMVGLAGSCVFAWIAANKTVRRRR